MLFFLLLMLLFRSVCHQVSNQADKSDLLAIFIISRCFAHQIQVGFFREMFFNHILLLVSCMLYMVKKHCPEEANLNRWAKRQLIIKIARRSNLSASWFDRLAIDLVAFTFNSCMSLLKANTLQLHNIPVDCARELFKNSEDVASLLDCNKKIGKLWILGFLWWPHKWGRFQAILAQALLGLNH